MKTRTLFSGLLFLLVSLPLCAQSQDRLERTRQFVVMGYQGIHLELTSRPGPYLKTLLELLETPTDRERKTTEQLKELLKSYPNIMDFADQVVRLQSVVEKEMGAVPVPVPQGPSIYTGEKMVDALEHLTRGMSVTVYLKTGEQLKGTFSEYTSRRLWLRGAARRTIALDDILAVDAPDL